MLTGAIIAGIVFGLYYTLVGLGLNLVFGVMRIVNLAHGDFLMLGGIVAWYLFSMFRPPPLVRRRPRHRRLPARRPADLLPRRPPPVTIPRFRDAVADPV